MVTLYHATTTEAAASIATSGFRAGTYFTTSLDAAWSFADAKHGTTGTVLVWDAPLSAVEETVAYFPGGGGTVYQMVA
jgi:hypothetical protein